MRQCLLVAMVGTWLLSGCSMPAATTSQSLPFLPMAVPMQPSARHEIALMRIDHLLQRKELTKNDRAQLFYERGLINDSLGLRSIAQIDFDRSLFFNPLQPEIYNLLGVFFTQDGKFDFAYDAFDSALELDNEYQLALFNRGITLFYAGRYHLALRDLRAYYEENINDPYGVIWLYLVEQKQLNAEEARNNLAVRMQESDQSALGWDIVKLFLNEISEQEFLREIQVNSFDNQQLGDRLTEGYFYLAKRYQQYGKESLAVASYKLAMSSNAYQLLEHRYSLLELSRISEQRYSEEASAN